MDSLLDQEETQDYIAELTGPGAKYDRSKYATEAEMWQAIAKGKVLADKTVKMQNERFDELREDFILERRENTAKDSFEELRKTLLEPKLEKAPVITTQKQEEKSSLSIEDVKNLLALEKQKEREEANLQQAETLLKQRFGEDAKRVFREKMNTLGLSDEDVKYLARKSPSALINALGLQQQGTEFDAPPRSSLRSDHFKPTVEIRDAIFYEKMRRENPKEYFSEKISVQRLKDMDDPDFLTRINERDRRRTNL